MKDIKEIKLKKRRQVTQDQDISWIYPYRYQTLWRSEEKFNQKTRQKSESERKGMMQENHIAACQEEIAGHLKKKLLSP